MQKPVDPPYDLKDASEKILRATLALRKTQLELKLVAEEFRDRVHEADVLISTDAGIDLSRRAGGLIEDMGSGTDDVEGLVEQARELADLVEFWRTRTNVEVRVSLDSTVRARSLGNG